MTDFDIQTPRGQLAWLLSEVTTALQITPTQYDLAVQRYETVGGWIDRCLEDRAVTIYPQGSMALQTTVKPRGNEEYDLDLVLEIQALGLTDPMILYSLVHDALASHGMYREILEPKKRCLRLNYAGEFHMDILPAVPDVAAVEPGAILVPDRQLRTWSASNPRGFRQWFEDQCAEAAILQKRAQVEPLPPNDDAQRKALLQQVVQLVKRNRYEWFAGHEDAPRSVVLTTLAGHAYHGESDLFGALLAVLNRIVAWSDVPPGRVLEVHNPTNPRELFSESWAAKPQSFDAFRQWVRVLRDRVARLTELHGATLDAELDDLFGERIMNIARVKFGERLQAAREANRLRFSRGSLTTAASGATIRSNRFYGGTEK